MKTTLVSSLVTFLLSVSIYGAFAMADNLPSPFAVIPQPKDVTLLEGPGLSSGVLKQVILKGGATLPVTGDLLSQLNVGTTAGKGSLILILDPSLADMPSEEGYVMTVAPESVQIMAKAQAGLFYGCQTLQQLLEDARDYQKPVPASKITDYPVLSYRSVHFDVKHHLDHMSYYYQSIDRLARYKINAVIFEFEDKLRYMRQPLVGAPQAISIDEMAALTRYARERNIEIDPLVQGLGHATFILKHQAYAGLREIPYSSWQFCPLHEGTYQVQFDLYRDAIDATPGSKYLHVGGDEVRNIGFCPRCKPTADKQGKLSLNLYWLKRVCEFAAQHNRIPIFWDDMPLHFANVYRSTYDGKVTAQQAEESWAKGEPLLDQLLADFPKNCVYMRWNYSMARQPGNIKALDWYQKHSLKAMVATATNSHGGMFFQQDVRDKGDRGAGSSVIRSFIQLAAEKGIYGMLCTAWDDKSPHMENYWRGFITAAEYSWSPTGRSLEQFDQAWLQKEFGIAIPDYFDFNAQLYSGSALWYQAYFRKSDLMADENGLQSLVRVEHWLPPLEGQEKVQFDYTKKLIELPDANSPGTWSEKYKQRLDKAQVEADNYQKLSGRLADLQNASHKNRYYWKLSLALYNLQSTAPRILLALKQCDTADKAQRDAGIASVKAAIEIHRKVWSDLVDVYGETRFTSYPPSYVPDRYFHLASQREDLTWMTQADDMFIGMINKWLQ